MVVLQVTTIAKDLASSAVHFENPSLNKQKEVYKIYRIRFHMTEHEMYRKKYV